MKKYFLILLITISILFQANKAQKINISLYPTDELNEEQKEQLQSVEKPEIMKMEVFENDENQEHSKKNPESVDFSDEMEDEMEDQAYKEVYIIRDSELQEPFDDSLQHKSEKITSNIDEFTQISKFRLWVIQDDPLVESKIHINDIKVENTNVQSDNEGLVYDEDHMKQNYEHEELPQEFEPDSKFFYIEWITRENSEDIFEITVLETTFYLKKKFVLDQERNEYIQMDLEPVGIEKSLNIRLQEDKDIYSPLSDNEMYNSEEIEIFDETNLVIYLEKGALISTDVKENEKSLKNFLLEKDDLHIINIKPICQKDDEQYNLNYKIDIKDYSTQINLNFFKDCQKSKKQVQEGLKDLFNISAENINDFTKPQQFVELNQLKTRDGLLKGDFVYKNSKLNKKFQSSNPDMITYGEHLSTVDFYLKNVNPNSELFFRTPKYQIHDSDPDSVLRPEIKVFSKKNPGHNSLFSKGFIHLDRQEHQKTQGAKIQVVFHCEKSYEQVQVDLSMTVNDGKTENNYDIEWSFNKICGDVSNFEEYSEQGWFISKMYYVACFVGIYIGYKIILILKKMIQSDSETYQQKELEKSKRKYDQMNQLPDTSVVFKD